ncbi:MAG: hypothetical protein ACRCYU_24470 [Nocardioides sp.]
MTWWADTALDGVVGGVVGGVATALAVAWTLRGTRRLGEVADCEVAVARMQGACVRASLTISAVADIDWIPFRGRMNDRLIVDLGEATAAIFEARGRAVKRWPGLAAEIDDLLSIVVDSAVAETKHLEKLTQAGLRIARDWLENHAAFERQSRRRRPLTWLTDIDGSKVSP